VRWGRLVSSRADQECEAIGFPAVVATPARRDSHHADGRIHPGGLVKAGLLAMEVNNTPTRPATGESGWAGMSGAGLLCHSLLVSGLQGDAILENPKNRDHEAVPRRHLAHAHERRRLLVTARQ
jgi:hypothetical protein